MTQKSPDKIKTIKVFCGELCKSNKCDASEINLLYRDFNGISANITADFEKFLNNPEKLPFRIIDLLQIAAYVFCADRMAHRGSRSSVYNDAWARSFEFNIPVKDYEFWKNPQISTAMGEALKFMTGDRKYIFNFKEAKEIPLELKNPQISFEWDEDMSKTDIMLFSGGLDSLAGAIQHLNDENERNLYLVSHKSNPSVKKTQTMLIKYLKDKYDRVYPYGFECHNTTSLKSIEETQRTRMFLFSAIAFTICNYYNKHEFYVFENGITSINLAKQGDVMNARASRTTHPKTLGLLKRFYHLFDDSFDIKFPYYNKTKADILEVFKIYDEKNIISSSISCSSTRKYKGQETHCGVCSQCIERRFAVYAADLDDHDEDAFYANDFISEPILEDEAKQKLYYTLRLACGEKIKSTNELLENYPSDIYDVTEYWSGNNGDVKLNEVYDLFNRYGDSIIKAAKLMQFKKSDLTKPVNPNSFLSMLSDQNYLHSPFFIKVNEIDKYLRESIPIMFQREKPKNENALNDKIESILKTKDKFSREYPHLKFGTTTYIADHAIANLIIEAKYARNTTTQSVISDGIGSDIIKIPDECGIMFVVYDPDRKITDDKAFIKSFEEKRYECFVRIYR